MTLPSNQSYQEEILEAPNGYIQPSMAGNMPVRCYINPFDKNEEYIDVLGSLKVKKGVLDKLKEYNYFDVKENLFTLLQDKKYEQLAKKFANSSKYKQIELYIQFFDLLINDEEAHKKFEELVKSHKRKFKETICYYFKPIIKKEK